MAIKKSAFDALSQVGAGATFDFVINGTNFKITKEDLVAALNVTGTIKQTGDVPSTPILTGSPGDHLIRNLIAGDGIDLVITAEDGIEINLASDLDIGTLEQVTTSGNTTTNDIVMEDSDIVLKDDLGNTRGLGAVNPTNVIVINSLSDFPTPSGGVIELVPFSGAEVTYVIAAATIDIGASKFTCTDGEVVIRGVHRTASKILSSASGVLFTVVDCPFFQELVVFNAPNAQIFDVSSVDPLRSFANQNLVIEDCQSIGTIADMFITSFRTFTLISSSVGGLTLVGADNNQFNMSNTLAFGWTGTLVDLGTATLNLIDMSANNRFSSPVGTTILSGLPSNGNLNSGGRGFVRGNLFNGDGTKLAGGIDEQDIQWQFMDNDGLEASAEIGCGNITVPVASANAGQGVMSPVLATTLAICPDAKRFTVVSLGTDRFGFRYDGVKDIDPKIDVRFIPTKVGGTVNECEVEAQLSTDGGTVFNAINSNTNGFVDATNRNLGGSLQVRTVMSTNDIIEFYQANNDSPTNQFTFVSMSTDIA